MSSYHTQLIIKLSQSLYVYDPFLVAFCSIERGTWILFPRMLKHCIWKGKKLWVPGWQSIGLLPWLPYWILAIHRVHRVHMGSCRARHTWEVWLSIITDSFSAPPPASSFYIGSDIFYGGISSYCRCKTPFKDSVWALSGALPLWSQCALPIRPYKWGWGWGSWD